MTAPTTLERVTEFYDAFYAGDAARLLDCCHEAFDSITYAPIALFPHLGHKRGKAWVTEAIRIQQERYSSRRHEIKFMTIDGAKASTIVSVALQKRSDQRVVQFETAEFFTLHDGLIASHRSFFDTFDVVEQVLGQELTDTFAAEIQNAMRAD